MRSSHEIFDEIWRHLLAILVLAVAVILPDTVWAQGTVSGNGGAATSLGAMICHIYRNLGDMPLLFGAFSWILGGYFVTTSGSKFRDHADDPLRNPLHQAIWRASAGSLFLAFPFFGQWLLNTIFRNYGGGYGDACTVGAAGAAGGGIPALDDMMIRAINNIADPMIALLSAFCYIVGALILIVALRKAANYSTDPRTNGMVPILASLSLGALLIAMPQTFDTTLGTLFGTNDVKNFAGLYYVPADADGESLKRFNAVLKAVFTFVQIVGWIAFIRGWFVIREKIEGGQASFAAGFTHIIGGAIAINMAAFIEVLQKTLGFAIIQVS